MGHSCVVHITDVFASHFKINELQVMDSFVTVKRYSKSTFKVQRVVVLNIWNINFQIIFSNKT